MELRNDKAILTGYVTAVDRDSRVLPSIRGDFIEVVKPKTFQRALDNASDVKLLFNHEKDRELGSISRGNLELYEDAIGLRVRAIIEDSEVIEKATKGLLTGWSFGFHKIRDKWETTKEGLQRRYLEDIELLEVSILDKTTAYIGTVVNSVESRKGIEKYKEKRYQDFDGDIVHLTSSKMDMLTKEIEILKMRGVI